MTLTAAKPAPGPEAKRKAAKMPRWKKSPQELIELFKTLMASYPQAQTRTMFGYPCAFVNGNMASGLFGPSLFVRLGPGDLAELLKLKGAKPFEPLPGRIMKSYGVVPEGFLGPKGPLGPWLERAVRFTASLPAKSRSKTKASPKKGR